MSRLRMLTAVFVVGLTGLVALAQDPAPSPQVPMPDMAAMMKKWMATVDPGPNHKYLDQFVGTWKTTMRMKMDPSAPAMETSGKATFKWVLGGRFLMQEFEGEAMFPTADGKIKKVPMSGIGLVGYDSFRNVFVAVWTSNLSTAMLTHSGTRSPDGKVLTMYGLMDEPMLDIIGRTVKYVTRIESDKRHVFEVYDLAAGDNYKAFDIVYDRE